MKLSEFDYSLPKELIAQEPVSVRDASRLMVLDRSKGAIKLGYFRDIVQFFNPGDCLILNDTKVIPARLIGKRPTGGATELFLLEKQSENTYLVLARPARRVRPGTKITFDSKKNPKAEPLLAEVLQDEGIKKIVRFSSDENLEEYGELPLPPYIARGVQKQDEERYQTVYAKNEGACAAPTAGLHFTGELLEDIKKKGVKICFLTLHVSYGTFAPIKEEDLAKHIMYKEYFNLPEETAEAVEETKKNKKKVFAVGTTATRTLEACAKDGAIVGREGWTDLFIYPPYKFKIVDTIITNFHLPKSTLFILVNAFAGPDLIRKAYKTAIEEKFRFYSYGDAMLIL